MNVPKCMSTQHPDNAASPPYASDGVVKGEGEVLEAAHVFALGCDEQMWDSEGKDVDRMVVSKLLTNHQELFTKQRLGRDCFLTLRVPNPSIEREMRKTLVETLESIPSAWDVAERFYGNGDAAPIHEVILPMTTSAEELNRLYLYYTNYIVGKEKQVLYGEYRVSDWLGEYHPRQINVIPLVEDLDHMLIADSIVDEYLRGKELPYQRVFLARSDPALNYGNVSAELMLKIALQRMRKLEEQRGIPLYPIIGVGSAPFRGNLTPLNVERAFREYPSAHTLTVQSAFKYDYEEPDVRAAIAQIRGHERGAPVPVDEERAKRLIKKYTAGYQDCVRQLAPIVAQVGAMVPKRRDRRLHIGLFGYSRMLDTGESGKEAIRLPRAISFCAAMYSIGIPPEVLGLAALDKEDFAFLREVYPSLEEDLAASLRFYHEKAVARLLGPKYESLCIRYCHDIDRVHEGLTTAVQASLESLPASHTQRYLVEAAQIRRFLG